MFRILFLFIYNYDCTLAFQCISNFIFVHMKYIYEFIFIYVKHMSLCFVHITYVCVFKPLTTYSLSVTGVV